MTYSYMKYYLACVTNILMKHFTYIALAGEGYIAHFAPYLFNIFEHLEFLKQLSFNLAFLHDTFYNTL